MKNIIKYLIIGMICLMPISSCSDWLDVVPEGTSRLENAFSSRTPALRYLFTCYSYLTSHDNGVAVDITGGDEVWFDSEVMNPQISLNGIKYAEGLQTAQSPLWDFWPRFYQALRDCNIFLENIVTVPLSSDFSESDRRLWTAEVKVLKAYYHFLLLRQYGPVPIVRESLSVSAGVDEVKVTRNKVDDVVDYAIQLIDEAIPDLEYEVYSVSDELGRITIPIALTIKAMILTTAASPIFNGNTLHATLKNHDGTQLINSEYSVGKWARAAEACKEAIDACEYIGLKLYEYPGSRQYRLTDTIMTQMSLRNAINDRWNDEIIWGDTKAQVTTFQTLAAPKLDTRYQDHSGMRQYFGPPLKIAEMFYSSNGIPINEDSSWEYNTRYSLRVANANEGLYVREGAQTSRLHFDREPRFYAWLGFDNGMWYGQGNYDDKSPSSLFYVQAKAGQPQQKVAESGSPTGYYVKKWIHFENVQNAATSYSVVWYVWPWFRLADLYLLYAESVNEAENNTANREIALEYLDKVRQRAGLATVQDAWSNYSIYNDKYTRQDGLRDIIRQERMIELCFERKRFWDLRRWMIATDMYQTSIQGWDVKQSDALTYYIPKPIFEQKFTLRDYFWPIPSSEITGNPNLVQNIGW
ncbi:MAG: RagB/SusD family nutrient uptake outer membrane protein [Bacteroidales bacterium]|jgi:hypothetical protein|nr:RagB/SusD family nutrient uptake outer membrane protein [Bacteroidales bacterium]